MSRTGVHTILVISDGTGATAAQVTRAALVQFPSVSPHLERRAEIRTRDQISQIIREARDRGAMVVHTLVSPELRRHLYMEATAYEVITVDLFGTILHEMATYLHADPQNRPTAIYGDADYARRMEAIEYTVNHDDGQNVDDLARADIILTGVSRTSKTPVSIFLAYLGYNVANIPIVLDIPLPAALEHVSPNRVVGLVVSPSTLAAIRRARVRQYGNLDFAYADPEHIRQELRYSRNLFTAHGWPVVDVSGRAVEETAREILSLVDPGGDHWT